ncbi:MAG TPA: ATP-binding protein [Polyangiaceae bacterium]|nr:ATP-binding protein [Polyangiaceae bacterium]
MPEPARGARSTIFAIACALASAAFAFVVRPYAQHSDVEMIHLLAIVLIALHFGVRDSLIACTVSILSFDFLFIPPRYRFALTDAKSSLVFIAMFVVAGVISTLTERMRQQELVARLAAFRAEALHALNVELSRLTDARQLAAVTARHLERIFGARPTILLRTPEGGFEGSASALELEHAERAWVRGEFTRVDAPDASSIWVPITGIHAPLGVVGLTGPTAFAEKSEQGFLLIACLNQLATATDRVHLASAVHRTEIEKETERLRSSLLSAVSHDLKTPLATMIAAATTLLHKHRSLEDELIDSLLSDVVNEGERLSELIANLLSITRLESPTLELRRLPQAVDEVVTLVVDRFSKRFEKPLVQVDIEPDLPLVSVEPLLLQQLLWNLLENGLRHAGATATLRVHATAGQGVVTVQVEDDGPGIPEHEREKVFEKFYRAGGARTSDGGVGLGLTICRAIVHAHGGRIAARARALGGTLVEFTLPVATRLPQLPDDAGDRDEAVMS